MSFPEYLNCKLHSVYIEFISHNFDLPQNDWPHFNKFWKKTVNIEMIFFYVLKCCIITLYLLQLRDLFYFFIILSVFIVSFGVAFHALLDPHQPTSWYTLVGVLWRTYWQMYGELFVGEDGLGKQIYKVDIHNKWTCPYPFDEQISI